jgi:DNA-binding GntR family transcriptional regulator
MSPVPLREGRKKSRELLSEGVRRRILSAILDGTLVAGERLHDDQLIQWLGVSRTPIRTALERLAEVGIIEMAPNRFTRVAEPSRESLLQALQIYAALNASAAETVVPALDAAARASLARRFGPVRGIAARGHGHVWGRPELETMDEAVGFFAERCANPLLQGVLYEIQVRLTFSFHGVPVEIDPDVLRAFVGEVLAACDRHDGTAVARALTGYLGSTVLDPAGDGAG